MSNEFIAKYRPFYKVECCFDIFAVFGNNIAGFGNNVEREFVLSIKSKQTEHVHFVSTLSTGRNFVVAIVVVIVAKNGNNVEATFDLVEGIVQLVAFDSVALTLLLVWTGRGLKVSTSSAAHVVGLG